MPPPTEKPRECGAFGLVGTAGLGFDVSGMSGLEGPGGVPKACLDNVATLATATSASGPLLLPGNRSLHGRPSLQMPVEA